MTSRHSRNRNRKNNFVYRLERLYDKEDKDDHDNKVMYQIEDESGAPEIPKAYTSKPQEFHHSTLENMKIQTKSKQANKE